MVAFSMRFNIGVSVIILAASLAALAQTTTYNVGRTPTDDEIRAWDIAVGPSGKELPAGRGTVKEGAKLYADKCARCHGATGVENGHGVTNQPLIGGKGTLTSLNPVKTVGSHWPFATTIWDYIRRAMPFGEEGSLSNDEVYALTAFLLYRNGIIKETDVIDAKTLPKVRMPNRNGFIPQRLDEIRRWRCNLGTCP